MTAAAYEIKPVTYGPTWQRTDEGWYLPKFTLGWQIIDWAEAWLLMPDADEDDDGNAPPWRFTGEQARFVLWWYAVDEEGRFVYRYGMLRRMKGWGKDPIAAVIASVEFIGPCRYAGYFHDSGPYAGQPAAKEHPAAWVQITATSLSQTRNTMNLFPGLLKKAKDDGRFRLDIGMETIYAYGGKRQIKSVTSSWRSLEGGRTTFTIKNETQHWIAANEGAQMSKVINRNAAKAKDGASRVLSISNAHEPGEKSDAELDYEAVQQLIASGKSLVSDMLYDSIEAPESVAFDDDEQMRAALEVCRGDSVWLDVRRLLAEIRAPQSDEAESRRFYLNQVWASESRAFNVETWNSLVIPTYRPKKKSRITLGGDGSKNFDHTAIIATELETGFQWVAGYWIPELDFETGELAIPVDEVEQAVAAFFEDYDVWRFYFDPFGWRESLDKWRGRYGTDKVVPWDTTQLKRMSVALLDYKSAMDEGEVRHDGDPRFTAAIGNARKRLQAYTDDKGEHMWTISKEHPNSQNKIDAAMAGCLSWKARNDAVALGGLNPAPPLQIFIPA